MSAWDGGPPRTVNTHASEQLCEIPIGCKIRVKTILGEDFSGELFAFDKSTNCVVIQELGENKTVRILKANYIKEVVETEARPAGSKEERAALPSLDMGRLQEREAQALKTAEEEAKKIGVGVSDEAQDLFDALSKTLPCRWAEKVIVVLDEVRIEEPYTPESCQGGSATVLSRVRKVLEGERARSTEAASKA
mmetsp:Transcript_15642/g.21624  ORF Transcript_15642/g.21624 Transcript_15642/m.21624 type:complete len:193 (+) Transcript_15642:185-763(+)|eukprot:CAMPEP_0196579218 /NCGR_PEP_ID=MMETSP1081-20130531/19159_1 /TAXON_ID=36882 /ORGANISM="Pyramimonas amylifera, Strain CCMP720" /LENGTH=192 /DNA_ID=CAMNT_0041898723 /DNA_START=182 /DNA_END=760 /DNA_ORIENTATION=+